jgi:hypothetical protein
MNMKRTIIFFLAVGWLTQLKAQSPGSAIYLMPAAQRFSFNSMNNILAQTGLAEVPMTFGSGVGGFGTVDRWRIGGEGTYFSGDASRGQNRTSLSGGLGYFYGAYVWQRKNWNIVPAVGIGFGGLTLTATRSVPASSLVELFSSEVNGSSVSIGDGFVHTSLGIERNISDTMFLGMKASYNMGLSSERTWKADGLTASLNDSFSSFQLSLNIGFILH